MEAQQLSNDDVWGEELGKAIVDGVKVALEKRDARINALEARLARLEAALEAR